MCVCVDTRVCSWDGGGAGDSEYCAALDCVVLPIAREFDPEIVVVSAGFDSARGDPLGGCELTPRGYARLTHRLLALKPGTRQKIAIVLEGGYNCLSVARSFAACVGALAGAEKPNDDDLGPPQLKALVAIARTARALARLHLRVRITFCRLFDARGSASFFSFLLSHMMMMMRSPAARVSSPHALAGAVLAAEAGREGARARLQGASTLRRRRPRRRNRRQEGAGSGKTIKLRTHVSPLKHTQMRTPPRQSDLDLLSRDARERSSITAHSSWAGGSKHFRVSFLKTI